MIIFINITMNCVKKKIFGFSKRLIRFILPFVVVFFRPLILNHYNFAGSLSIYSKMLSGILSLSFWDETAFLGQLHSCTAFGYEKKGKQSLWANRVCRAIGFPNRSLETS